jgi:hypothetical protein
MKNSGLGAAAQLGARPLKRWPSTDRIGQGHRDQWRPSGLLHSCQHLLHLAGVTLEEPKQAL